MFAFEFSSWKFQSIPVSLFQVGWNATMLFHLTFALRCIEASCCIVFSIVLMLCCWLPKPIIEFTQVLHKSIRQVKGIVHFEINVWYVLAYLKGIQEDVGVFVSTVFSILIFLGQTVLVCQLYNGGLWSPPQRACTESPD